MKNSGRWAALLGLILAIALFVASGVAPIFHLVLDAGFGLILAGLFHALPMLMNARAWQTLLMPAARPKLSQFTMAIWVRESVNGLLPVARIGGEVAAYRLLARQGAARVPIAASLIVDMALSLLSQGLFCLLGVALWIALDGGSALSAQLAIGLLVLLVLATGFVVAQSAGLLGLLVRAVDRLVAGRWPDLLEQASRIDLATREIYQNRGRLLRCLLWQMGGWLAGAGEIWLALYFLGHEVALPRAVMIEALIQAISSVAFFVPGALGVQEGGFLLLGTALGIDGPTSLALAAARRLRDLVVFFPGLLAWHQLEARSLPAAGEPRAP